MSKSSLFIFRILLVAGGMLLAYIVGKPLAEKISYRIGGDVVTGRIIGFRGKGTSKAVLEDNTGRSNGNSKARRPVFRYPVSENSLDSLEGFSTSGILLPWFNYKLNEKVTVVKELKNPANAYIFGAGILLSDLLLLLLCIFMIRIGFYQKKA
ncbi:MAG: hypothetical protein IPN29_14910 [Saprospiraceae bacterium]|nr:hypothetical protein [Saprospiraceae bacterium]